MLTLLVFWWILMLARPVASGVVNVVPRRRLLCDVRLGVRVSWHGGCLGAVPPLWFLWEQVS